MFNAIMTELCEEEIVKNIIRNMKIVTDADDLEQEIYMILLEYDKEKIIEMYQKKQLKFFIVGIIQRQYHSKTSPFYKKYKKYYSMVDENTVNANEVYDDCDEE